MDSNDATIKKTQMSPDKENIAIPKAPNPSADPGVLPHIASLNIKDDDGSAQDDFDVASLEPLAALKLLSQGIQALADMTGDLPPTPLVPRSRTPSVVGLTQEQLGPRPRTPSRPATPVPSDDLREAALDKEVIGASEAHINEPHAAEPEPSADPLEQNKTIARKFFSKKPPPIPINEYLLRLHRFCPMSTAVYLAAGSYIQKLALVDRSVPVTMRTVHRLLLAALRVAMKALEDLSYPHERFAGVGGVSEQELAKMEISFCYLINWDLRLDNATMHDRIWALKQLAAAEARHSAGTMTLKSPPRRRTLGEKPLFRPG